MKDMKKCEKSRIKVGAKSGNLSSEFRSISEVDSCPSDTSEFRGSDLSLVVFSYIVGSFAYSSLGNI